MVLSNNNKSSVKELFTQSNWWWMKYDGRKKMFRGISREDFTAAKEAHIARALRSAYEPENEYAERRSLIRAFASIPYAYKGDGMDDYSLTQRPSSNGIGYCAVCPGERGNNIYTDDPIAVAYLTKKYSKYKAGI